MYFVLKSVIPDQYRCYDGFLELEVKEYQKQVDKGDGNFTIDGLMTVMISSWKSLEEEEEAILSAFRVFDKENTGRIDADELRHIFVTLGDALTQEEVSKCRRPAISREV